MRKGQGRKTILDARDLRALRRHCITYRNATVMESQHGLRNTSRKHVGEHNPPCHSPLPAINSIGQKRSISKHDPEAQAFSLGQGSFKMDCGKVENCSVVRRIKIWSSFLENWDAMSSGLKRTRDNPSCYQRSVQKACISDGMGSWVRVAWAAYTSGKAPSMLKRYIQVLEQHMLPSRRRLFQGRPCIFQHDNARPHTASITTSWLRRRRSGYWNGQPAVQIFHP